MLKNLNASNVSTSSPNQDLDAEYFMTPMGVSGAHITSNHGRSGRTKSPRNADVSIRLAYNFEAGSRMYRLQVIGFCTYIARKQQVQRVGTVR